ncbi:hypothetical protein B0H17DRAFT_1103181 [Mycena rosella]|uniref:Uncharacterized protein n=1 Tax=Mycena rosella TaxID=1033263 RepID=A0AAD7CH32_MYCRO|nr:hypothetical protein B0H17DRAFT_1103181 [Mycena rosella]
MYTILQLITIPRPCLCAWASTTQIKARHTTPRQTCNMGHLPGHVSCRKFVNPEVAGHRGGGPAARTCGDAPISILVHIAAADDKQHNQNCISNRAISILIHIRASDEHYNQNCVSNRAQGG